MHGNMFLSLSRRLSVHSSLYSSFHGISSCSNPSQWFQSGDQNNLSGSTVKDACPGEMLLGMEGHKVAVIGAAGGVGQPLSLMLKLSTLISELSLYDVTRMPGVAADLSHCSTAAKVKGFMGEEELEQALEGAELVIIPAGHGGKPGMTRGDLFDLNAGILKGLIAACAKHCPGAILNIITNPVNAMVPLAAEILKAAGVYDPKKLLGVTTLDAVRAKAFVAEAKGLDVKKVDVPVVGGHAEDTILPLLSQVSPKVVFSEDEIQRLTTRIQDAGTVVLDVKAGDGSATLSAAFAGARMAESCLLGLRGERNIAECAYVQSNVMDGLEFFASKVVLGEGGVEHIPALGEITHFEKKYLEETIPRLQASINKGVAFANGC